MDFRYFRPARKHVMQNDEKIFLQKQQWDTHDMYHYKELHNLILDSKKLKRKKDSQL